MFDVRTALAALTLWTLVQGAGVVRVFAAPLQLRPEEAVSLAFPGAQAVSENLFLTNAQAKDAATLSGEEISSRMVKRFLIRKDGKRVGTAYLDSHRVRSSGESLLVALAEDGSVLRIEVVSFFEPAEYQPRSKWLEQFNGKRLNEELQLKRGIRPITGATLTGRAVTAASRRVLGIHQAVEKSGQGK